MDSIVLSKEVSYALKKGEAVVALESTLISHGMPYPQNVTTGKLLESEIREYGAIPATIAIIGGVLRVGLENNEMERLGKEGEQFIKTSRRDIPFIVSKGLNGATTVASTMIIANMAGIRIFATGGIGGVHRGAGESMDVSADLMELSKTKVAVISAGVKSILDIGLTLEYLETLGVPVLGYKTHEFPAFYTRESGYQVDYKMDSPEEIAQALYTKWDSLHLTGGAIIANPIPESFSYDKHEIDEAISKALIEVDNLGIKGKAVTPFLLAKVKEITGGKSLESNIALARNNAILAAKIAKAYQQEVNSSLGRKL